LNSRRLLRNANIDFFSESIERAADLPFSEARTFGCGE